MFKVRTNTKPRLEVKTARPCKDGEGVSSIAGVKRRITHEASRESKLSSDVYGESIAQEMQRDAVARAENTYSNNLNESGKQTFSVSGACDTERRSNHRNLVRIKILEGLRLNDTPPFASSCDFVTLAARIEEALYTAFVNNPRDYATKARSVFHNLNDKNNFDFRTMLMIGFIKPKEVPYLDAAQMGSYEKLNARARLKKELMDEARSDWELHRGMLHKTTLFVCESCTGSNATYFQLQTRRCDEPETNYVMCLDCRYRWKC